MRPGENARRPKRVSGLIRSHLGRIFIRDIQPHFSSLVTITRVNMTPDLQTARVFLTILGPDDPASVLKFLEDQTPHLRHSVASSINLKYNPQLFFEMDPEPEWQSKIDRLIRRNANDDQEAD